MTIYDDVEAILRRLPRGPECSDELIRDMAGRIVIANHWMGMAEPLPEKQRALAKEAEKIAAILLNFATPGTPEAAEAEDAQRTLESQRHRIHLDATRPKRERARVVTAIADTAFESITGKPAPRTRAGGYATGPLVEFVSDLFAVLRIKASAGSQVKSLWDRGK